MKEPHTMDAKDIKGMIQILAQLFSVQMKLAAPPPLWCSLLFTMLMRLPKFKRAFEREIAISHGNPALRV